MNYADFGYGHLILWVLLCWLTLGIILGIIHSVVVTVENHKKKFCPVCKKRGRRTKRIKEDYDLVFPSYGPGYEVRNIITEWYYCDICEKEWIIKPRDPFS